VSNDIAQRSVVGDSGGCPVLAGYDPMDPAELRDPFPSYARARREVPVFYSEAYGFWSVSRREDVLELLRDPDRFSSSGAIPLPLPPEEIRHRMPVYPMAKILILREQAQHGPARRMLQAPFTPKRLRDMAPLIRARAEELLRPGDPDRRIEFMSEYATPLALSAIGEIMGVPEEDYPLLQRAVAQMVRIISGTLREDEVPLVAQGQLEYWEYLLGIVERCRREPGDDFSSVLATYVNEDGSTPSADDIAANLGTLLSAGFENSAQMMSFGVGALLEHRDQWELLRSDRSLVGTAVEECLRYRNGLKRIFRWVVSDAEIGGVRIPAGSLVAGLVQSSNRDEATYPDPDRFDITRKIDNLTFGRGRHFCVGAPLARLELRVTLEALLDLAPDARLAEDHELGYPENLVVDMVDALRLDLGPVPDALRPC
jgi:cytochrome P450